MELKDLNIALESNKTYLLIFTTSWCGDCKVLKKFIGDSKIISSLSKKDFEIIEINAEEKNLLRTSDFWKVEKVPSCYIIKNEKIKFLGYEYIPISYIEKEIKEVMENENFSNER